MPLLCTPLLTLWRLHIFQFIYNADGDVLRSFIAHKGEVVPRVQQHFKDTMTFCQTEDGLFCEPMMVELLIHIDMCVNHEITQISILALNFS